MGGVTRSCVMGAEFEYGEVAEKGCSVVGWYDIVAGAGFFVGAGAGAGAGTEEAGLVTFGAWAAGVIGWATVGAGVRCFAFSRGAGVDPPARWSMGASCCLRLGW